MTSRLSGEAARVLIGRNIRNVPEGPGEDSFAAAFRCVALSAGSSGGRSAKGQTAKTSLCHVRFAADPKNSREFVVLF
jgi:hypothetical protein